MDKQRNRKHFRGYLLQGIIHLSNNFAMDDIKESDNVLLHGQRRET